MQSRQLATRIVLALLVGAILLTACNNRAQRGDSVAGDGMQSTSANDNTMGQAEGSTVAVTLHEFSVTLDRSPVPAGVVTFVVENQGHAAHDFVITGNGVEENTPILEPGQSATLTVELSPGTYDYVCTIPGHAVAGMRGTFRVS